MNEYWEGRHSQHDNHLAVGRPPFLSIVMEFVDFIRYTYAAVVPTTPRSISCRRRPRRPILPFPATTMLTMTMIIKRC